MLWYNALQRDFRRERGWIGVKIRFAVLLALVLALGCAAALAETTYTSGDFVYVLTGSGDAELIRYLGDADTVVLPKDLDGHPVTSVRGNLFAVTDANGSHTGVRDCSLLVHTDHAYLATIDGVLYGKTDKKLIYCPPSREGVFRIPDGIQSIGDNAFECCDRLTAVEIPSSVSRIGAWAFYDCAALADIVIPQGVHLIPEGAFAYAGLTAVTIPDSVVSIRDDAFHSCASLRGLDLPESVRNIGDAAFKGCDSLTELRIPSGVTSLGREAFAWCTGLTALAIPDSVTSLGESTFKACAALTEVKLSAGLKRIPDAAFCECTSLTAVVIPDGVQRIGEDAFFQCAHLSAVTIPPSVTDIGEHTFSQCAEDLTLTGFSGSFAETYALDHGLHFTANGTLYGDSDDWLNP